MSKSQNLGRFGKLVKHYEIARRPYPPQVFKFLKDILPLKNPTILDLGCGTGISTRQLAKLGQVTGCDPDPLMLKAAAKHKKIDKEKYVIGRANKLPFPKQSFDVVTAFGAFHWFSDRKSMNEIKRVLKPGGLIFVVNKTGVKSWGEGYRRAIMKSIHNKVAIFGREGYYPKTTLKENGFKKIQSQAWKDSEFFTIPRAVEYVQSISIWNSLSKPDRLKAVKGLEQYYKRMKRNKGKIERRLTVTAVAAIT